MLVKRVALNTQGRDFVIGDIHGAFDSVLAAMASVKFDPVVDRLFSTGDLVDRGSGSARVLKFLLQPYVYAVRGNHDHFFAEYPLDDIRAMGKINWNGMAWVAEICDYELVRIQQAFESLPVVLEVPTCRGLVGIVHADVPSGMNWSKFTDLVAANDQKTIETALWGRERARTRDQSGVADIGRVFVGHTPQLNGASRLGNVYFIDTGAVFKELDAKEYSFAHLTISNLICKTESFGKPTGQEKDGIFSEGGIGLFGSGMVKPGWLNK